MFTRDLFANPVLILCFHGAEFTADIDVDFLYQRGWRCQLLVIGSILASGMSNTVRTRCNESCSRCPTLRILDISRRYTC